MTIDLDVINSATRYGSIETFHKLDRGRLTEELNFTFEGNVILTEKIDGTNARVIVMPDGDFFIGSRKEILHAKGDRRIDPTESIVETMLPVAQRVQRKHIGTWAVVFYGEVYGGKIGPAAKQYTSTGSTGFRLFDVAYIPMDVFTWERPTIATWREGGGQKFANETTLRQWADRLVVDLTPRKGTISAEQLPTTLPDMHDWLANEYAIHSVAMLDGEDTPGASEGLVLRTQDRSIIAKARLADYAKVLRSVGKRR